MSQRTARSEVQKQTGRGDPERCRAEANRRATQQIRRIITEHRCTRFITLTLAPGWATEDRAVMVGYLRDFQRELKRIDPSIVYILVPEPHPGGHGWHCHGALNKYIDKDILAAAWGRGFIDVRRFRARGSEGAREVARKAGAYLAKYVGKSIGEGLPAGSHRFYRPQGVTILEVRAEGTFLEVLEALKTMMTSPPKWIWSSASSDDWRGPPVVSVRW